MKEYKLIKYPDPLLKKECLSVSAFSGGELKLLVETMKQIMKENNGVGLATTQIGENIKLFVMRLTEEDEDADADDSAKETILVFINPKLVRKSGRKKDIEGCLSFPDITASIYRYTTIDVEAVDENGKPFELTLHNFNARVFQHEFDHINGILFITRMSNVEKIANAGKLKALEEEFYSNQ